jgi:hypothetical protein
MKDWNNGTLECWNNGKCKGLKNGVKKKNGRME